ncbi:MAG: flagellar M-ring protein FliF C-terminal domain-containing protein [Candidatus Gastranaerophilales bacterium]|nr:flagellar M-ring protein FliF C-terminal domain-containing protein [Candidatus Gastranaerophilales bacterium]
MDFQKLLQNKNLMIALVVTVAVILVAGFFFSLTSGGKGSDKVNIDPKDNEKLGKPTELLTSDNTGKILEIEALLAKHRIETERDSSGGSKVKLFLKKDCTRKQRDEALLLVVQSGLADANIGLEVFDKGDFTSTKDDKRIRLARAINGELSRLIRKIKPVENASVFISIPEPTIFTSLQKPTTATVQLVLPVGDKLSKDKIRAVTNLLLGSISGLELDNISITDTNGNVYSSIAGADDDTLAKIEENDEYMKAKVQTQLDKLLGKGNYVVTVSTYLRQAPIERNSIIYDPNRNVVVSQQKFSENLGDKNSDKGQLTGATSLYLPGGLPQAASSNQNRNYSRTAEEMQYGATKTQVAEYLKPGMIEDISIAVTIENNAIPETITPDELKELIASAASPKVNAENVEIVFADSVRPTLAGDKAVNLPAPEGSGNPWWTIAVLLFGGLIVGLITLSKKISAAKNVQERQIQELKELNALQDNQLQAVNQRAQILLAQQEQLQQSLNSVRQPVQVEVPRVETLVQDIHETADDEELAIQLKSWIEQVD